MGMPSGFVAGTEITANDVKHIYESLTAYSENIYVQNIYSTDFSASANAIFPFLYSKIEFEDSTPSSLIVLPTSDVNNVFIAYSLDPSSSYEGHIKKISWKDQLLSKTYNAIAICLKSGASTYKWVEIHRSFT